MGENNFGLLSPWLRRQRIKMAGPYLRGRVLDFGCGPGELAALCSSDVYIGVDRDRDLLLSARKAFPMHRFQENIGEAGPFDTIVLLAVIEHVQQPDILIQELAATMTPQGHVILTTPHPRGRWIHDLGAKMGLFSCHAAEEHETFLDSVSMERICEKAELHILQSKFFQCGFNQLFVLGR